jgi:ABC-type lipoprotein export system ATPase subunit
MLDRLASPEDRTVIVSGDSGSGKSSLVDAGVLSRLEAESEEGTIHCFQTLPLQVIATNHSDLLHHCREAT